MPILSQVLSASAVQWVWPEHAVEVGIELGQLGLQPAAVVARTSLLEFRGQLPVAGQPCGRICGLVLIGMFGGLLGGDISSAVDGSGNRGLSLSRFLWAVPATVVLLISRFVFHRVRA